MKDNAIAFTVVFVLMVLKVVVFGEYKEAKTKLNHEIVCSRLCNLFGFLTNICYFSSIVPIIVSVSCKNDVLGTLYTGLELRSEDEFKDI